MIRRRIVVGRNGDRPAYPYTPTDIITTQGELDTFLAQSAATLEGKVAGIQYNATPYTIARTQLRKNYGTGGLVLMGYGATRPVFSSVAIERAVNLTLYGVEISDPTSTSGNLLAIYTQSDQITISNNVIHGKALDPNADYSSGNYANTGGIQTISNGTGSVDNLTITGNTIYDVTGGITLSLAGASAAWSITQNTVRNTYEDNIKISMVAPPASLDVSWNVLSELVALSADATVPPPHPDHLQLIGGSVDAGGITILGNIIFGGTSRGQGQGIFLDDMTAGHYFTATIKGNVVACGSANGLKVNRAKNCTIIGNTVLARDVAQSASVVIAIGQDEDGGGNVTKNSTAKTITVAGTSANNHAFGTQDSTTYSSLFDGPTFTSSALSSRAAVLSALSMKVGGSLDAATNIGAVGSGYVDFDARTLNAGME